MSKATDEADDDPSPDAIESAPEAETGEAETGEAEPGEADAAGESGAGGEPEAEASEGEGEAEDAAAPADPPPAAPGLLAMLREYYFTFDRRTLGFARIMLGFFLCMDVVHRGAAWKDMYSTEGVLPNHVNLHRPQAHGAFSIFNAFSTPWELRVLWVVMFATFFCLLIGYKTKVMQVLSVIFVTGMNGRVLLIENGGYVVHNLLTMWTAFLPMGDRFSLDAMLASMRARREATEDELNDREGLVPEDKLAPHVTLLGLVLLIQLSAIYFFNVVHKTGPAWKNGTAVHYVLYVDRMVTPMVGQVRTYLPNWMLWFMTKSTLAFEAGLPVALLSPLGRVWAKRIAIFMINTLHLAFGASMVLGPFAWALCCFSTLLFSPADWEIANATMRREHRARTIVYDRRSGGALLACRILKRLDRFELLTFQAADDVPLGIAILAEDGSLITRSAAWADIVAAIPLGPAIAWILRLPGVHHLLDAIAARLESRDLSATLGFPLLPSRVVDASPSSLRRGLRWTVAGLRELGIAAMFAGAVNQAMVELWVIKNMHKFSQPEPLRLLSHKMRFLQGWFMFSPNPVMDDGTIVVDAITIDGRHIDPFTQKEPDWNLGAAKSLALTQIWCDYYNRMHLPGNTGYRDAMKEYMYRLPQRTGNPNDVIVSGEVFWIQDMNPAWNQKVSTKFEKQSLFKFENPAARSRVAGGQ